MTRRIVLTVVALLLVTVPAVAKGVDGVVLTAGDQEVTITWQHAYGEAGDLASLIHTTHLYDVDWVVGSSFGGAWEESLRASSMAGVPAGAPVWGIPEPDGSSSIQGLAGGDLGPVVVATWNFPDPVDSVIVQHLYPFAENGPVGHVLPDQEYFDEAIVGAWHPLRPEVTEALTAAGLDLTRLETGSDSALVTGGIVLALWGIIAARRWRDGTIRR